MFCGSCMHDNTWARALMQAGHEVSLIPTYTPIRVDEHNESSDRVFMGGINVYLNHKSRVWRHLPRGMKSWLDHPRVIRMLTRRAVSNDASELGDLAISMLSGEHGPHRQAIEELDRYISEHLKPDVVVFSNALLAGAVKQLKQRFNGPILCVLQGDDVFLDGLADRYRTRVTDMVSECAQDFDGFLTHSRFYRDYMAKYLRLEQDKFSVLPLGIDFAGHVGLPESRSTGPLTVGYFARIAPEKGLHHLIDGFVELRKQIPDAQLKIGGFLGKQYKPYLEQCFTAAKGHQSAISYVGSPATHEEKVAFLNSIDVLSVPTEFLEPKGLYVLEALANGIPVVQPRHGAFPEIIEATQGGLLVTARDAHALADGLQQMIDVPSRLKFAQDGWNNVRSRYSLEEMATRTLEIVEDYCAGSR